MTKAKAIELLKEWLASDKELINEDPESDFSHFLREKDEALEVAIEALKESQWISVEDRLPEEGKNYLVFIPFKGVAIYYVSYMESGKWFVPTMFGRDSLDDVTHWMPLPELYKEGE